MVVYAIFKFKLKKSLASIILVAAFLGVFYPFKYNNQTNIFWSVDDSLLSRSSFYFMLNTAEEGTQPEWSELLWFSISKQAPPCLIEYRSSATDELRSPWVMSDLMPVNCNSGVRWLNENFEKKYYEFIASNPKLAVKYLIFMTSKVGDNTGYIANTIVPESLSQLFESSHEKQHKFTPIIGWLTLGILCVLYLITFRIKLEAKFFISSLFFGFGVLSMALSLLIIITEPVRITTPSVAIVMLGSLLLISELSQRLLTIPIPEVDAVALTPKVQE
jgi:hypothetical protein